MQLTLNQPDGLYLHPQATLAQLEHDPMLKEFADSLIPYALALTPEHSTSLGTALYHPDNPVYTPLLTALAMIDAELKTVINKETRALPLAAFFSYRHRLAQHQITINMVRVPPLNPDGHYLLRELADNTCIGVRLDLHPLRKVAGHVRLVVTKSGQPPERLTATEGRLEWQKLTDDLITEAILLSSHLSDAEQVELANILNSL